MSIAAESWWAWYDGDRDATAETLLDRYVAHLGNLELAALIKINILSVSSFCAFSRSQVQVKFNKGYRRAISLSTQSL